MTRRKPQNDKQRAPWNDEQAKDWLGRFEPWLQAIRLIHGTLQLETKKHPQEIRAAVALVVLCCRENLWPTRDENEIEKILELAVRQLSTIKQLYETKARINPEVINKKNYRDLLISIDQEIRILEARMSDPKPSMPNEPPVSWGKFWT